MDKVTREDTFEHCRNCVNNKTDYWCEHYKANPSMSLLQCSKENFVHKKLKETE